MRKEKRKKKAEKKSRGVNAKKGGGAE